MREPVSISSSLTTAMAPLTRRMKSLAVSRILLTRPISPIHCRLSPAISRCANQNLLHSVRREAKEEEPVRALACMQIPHRPRDLGPALGLRADGAAPCLYPKPHLTNKEIQHVLLYLVRKSAIRRQT